MRIFAGTVYVYGSLNGLVSLDSSGNIFACNENFVSLLFGLSQVRRCDVVFRVVRVVRVVRVLLVTFVLARIVSFFIRFRLSFVVLKQESLQGKSISVLLPEFFEETGLNVPVSPVRPSTSGNASFLNSRHNDASPV